MTTLCWYWRIIGSWEKKEPTSIAAWWVKLYMRLHATMPCYLFSFKKNNIELQRYISEKKRSWVELAGKEERIIMASNYIILWERKSSSRRHLKTGFCLKQHNHNNGERERLFYMHNFQFFHSLFLVHFLHNSTHQLNVFSNNLLVLMLRCFSSARSCCNINF